LFSLATCMSITVKVTSYHINLNRCQLVYIISLREAKRNIVGLFVSITVLWSQYLCACHFSQ